MKLNDQDNLTPFQAPLPAEAAHYPKGLYETLPAFTLDDGVISAGYAGLAARIRDRMPQGLRVLVIDGFPGLAWELFRQRLQEALTALGITPAQILFEECRADSAALNQTLAPFLGGDDRLFGTHFPFGPEPFFQAAKVAQCRIEAARQRGDAAGKLTIIAGTGASLVELWDELWYIDLPKDLIQERFRQGRANNLGHAAASFEEFYKRCYFVEWPAFSRQKRRILADISLFIDLQDEENPAFMAGEDFRAGLVELARSPFRVRPWFYPGPWGGQFMKHHMDLARDKPNYAWSFELIVPENGILFRSGERRLECSFDFAMFAANREILGEHAAAQFKYEWPIRFDYLDTIDGGNLSVQVHPRPDYIKEQFGETYTQDETYYIVNAKPGSRVYLGLREGVRLEALRQALQDSAVQGIELDIDAWINSEPAQVHDLFCIPNGTVHCSGQGNLVLEISATPYIFTFKVYDYLRRDLEGNLRPINIERGLANIRPERTGEWVRRHLVAQPRLLESTEQWQLHELYNQPFTFYTILRAEFAAEYRLLTQGRGFAINLVEGEEVEVRAASGRSTTLAWLETMIIPAAADEVTFVNRGRKPCKLLLVSVKPEAGVAVPLNDPND